MALSGIGRMVFGAAAVLYGVVELMLHHTIVASCLGIAQAIAGIGMLYPRTTPLASVALGVVYAFFALDTIPGIVRAPSSYVQYGNFFEQFCLFCGAIAAYGSAVLGRIARIGIGLCAASFGIEQIVYLQFTASLVPTWIPPGQVFWTDLTTGAFLLAAIAILINRRARLALRLMSVMVALFGVLVWIPHIVAKPDSLGNWSEFAETCLIAGAAWLVADLA